MEGYLRCKNAPEIKNVFITLVTLKNVNEIKYKIV